MTAAAAPHVDVGRECVAHVGGVYRCGSPWTCPLCAPVIRQRRAGEIEDGLTEHLRRGGSAEFITLTARHGLHDPLTARFAVMARALGHLLCGSAWKRRRDRLGYSGSVRAVEVTWGEENGWHPHTHALLLFDRPLSEAERADLAGWIFSRWNAHLVGLGLGSITREHGIDVRAVTTSAGLGDYLAKIESGWTPALELARMDAKRSTPFGLLERLRSTGESRWAALWLEYEAATAGRASVMWSRGLKAALRVDQVEDDAALAASEGLDVALFRAWFDRLDWNVALRAGHVPALCAGVEDVAATFLFCLAIVGVDPVPIDPGPSP